MILLVKFIIFVKINFLFNFINIFFGEINILNEMFLKWLVTPAFKLYKTNSTVKKWQFTT